MKLTGDVYELHLKASLLTLRCARSAGGAERQNITHSSNATFCRALTVVDALLEARGTRRNFSTSQTNIIEKLFESSGLHVEQEIKVFFYVKLRVSRFLK